MAKFTDIFEDVTKQGTKIPTNLYLETGMYPIIDQGQSQVAGYTNQTEGLFTDIPAIIFGDHTRIIKYIDTPCFLGADGVKLLKAKDPTANYKYLYYALCNADIPNTGYNRHFKWLKEIEIPEYSSEEQSKIVAQFEEIDNVISLRKQQLAKLDELVKSRFIELLEKEEYKKVTVSSVLNTGFWLMPATPEFIVDGEVPYITSKNIKNRTIDFDNVKYISREAYKSISANRPTQKGDILISMIGTLGQTAVIQDDREFYGQNLYLLRLNNAIVNTTYFCEFFNSDTAQYKLQGKRNQSTQAYLKANHVEDLILSLPPMKLQEQFAAFVEQVDKSKVEIQKSLQQLETLKKALMQKYFG